ncbi:MAG: 23S rRNA pseudouridine1911/1915/1917 synthase [Saprospiraceae bacterium]|jgi:23S rRNA pseudouridine1911/1915/1917 synthase
MLLIEQHIVSENISNVRLSDYCGGIFTQIPSRKGMKKAIDRGEVKVNGAAAGTGKFINTGDLVELVDLQETLPKPYELKIPVVFEDDFLAVVNKPAGLVTSGNQFKTLQNSLVANLRESTAIDALKFPQVVHRLDAPTSGLVLVAKTAQSRIALSRIFENREIKKTYQAIVIGQPKAKGDIDIQVDEKEAFTSYKISRIVPSLRNTHLSLLNLNPKTGRTHQLRKHLAAIGYPIFGDKLYGEKGEIYKGKGLFLAAVKLEFTHPITTKEMIISVETPHKFISLLSREKRRFEDYSGV